jgi:hypothetical protein
MLLLTSCAATLRLSWTMPVLDNEGTCSGPVLSPSPLNAFVRARFSFLQNNIIVARDSVDGRAGQFFASRPFPVPKAGPYQVAVITVDSLGNVATCDTTINAFAKGKPWIVPDLKAQ